MCSGYFRKSHWARLDMTILCAYARDLSVCESGHHVVLGRTRATVQTDWLCCFFMVLKILVCLEPPCFLPPSIDSHAEFVKNGSPSSASSPHMGLASAGSQSSLIGGPSKDFSEAPLPLSIVRARTRRRTPQRRARLRPVSCSSDRQFGTEFRRRSTFKRGIP